MTNTIATKPGHSQAAYDRARSDFQADRPADPQGCSCYQVGWSDAEAFEAAAEAQAEAEAAERARIEREAFWADFHGQPEQANLLRHIAEHGVAVAC